MIGTKVSVRGSEYVITRVGPMGEGKFFGKRKFWLKSVADGSEWTAYGNRVAGNSKLEQV